VRYCGCVDFTKSTEVLKNYYALLFPTYYEGEGYANTIVDAFAAALPVIATNWKYNGEVICHGVDGILYDYQKPELLTEILASLVDRPQTIITMKHAARERAFCYSPDQALTSLYSKIE
jgi:glycosyltransferase involved in cell wall biosynthesis